MISSAAGFPLPEQGFLRGNAPTHSKRPPPCSRRGSRPPIRRDHVDQPQAIAVVRVEYSSAVIHHGRGPSRSGEVHRCMDHAGNTDPDLGHANLASSRPIRIRRRLRIRPPPRHQPCSRGSLRRKHAHCLAEIAQSVMNFSAGVPDRALRPLLDVAPPIISLALPAITTRYLAVPSASASSLFRVLLADSRSQSLSRAALQIARLHYAARSTPGGSTPQWD